MLLPEEKIIQITTLSRFAALLYVWITEHYTTLDSAAALAGRLKNAEDTLTTLGRQLTEETTARTETDAAINEHLDEVEQAVISVNEIANTTKTTLETLIGSGEIEGVIDTFKEVESFLHGVASEKTLTGLLKTLKDEVEEDITRGDNTLNSVIAELSSHVDAVETELDTKKADLNIVNETFRGVYERLSALEESLGGKSIVVMDEDSYEALEGEGKVDNNTLYFILEEE